MIGRRCRRAVRGGALLVRSRAIASGCCAAAAPAVAAALFAGTVARRDPDEPTTRFGYLLYPVALLVWAPALSRRTGTSAPREDPALYRH